MTNSLKEEIRNAFYTNQEPPLKTSDLHYTENIIIDRIIKIFEKRIDSIPERFVLHDTDFAEGFATAILKIKEMLK